MSNYFHFISVSARLCDDTVLTDVVIFFTVIITTDSAGFEQLDIQLCNVKLILQLFSSLVYHKNRKMRLNVFNDEFILDVSYVLTLT